MMKTKPKNNEYKQTKEFVNLIWNYPHVLGNILGYRYLQAEHSKWIRYVFLASKDNTLQAFRGSFKTTAISVVGSIWYLLFYPDNRILLASSTADNARKILNEIRTQYQKDKLRDIYRLMDVLEPIDYEWWRKESIALTTRKRITKEGNIEAVGALNVVTSRHYEKILCDDLVVLKDRISKAEREKKKEWVKELQSIIEPTGTISYIGTPWHPEDVYAITPKAIKYPVGTILNPKLTEDRLKEIRRMQGEVFFNTQYKLEHIKAEDMVFDNPLYGEYIPVDDRERLKLIGYLDPAFGGTNFTALSIGGKKDKKLYVKAGYMWKAFIDKTYDRIEREYKRHGLFCLYVEANASQKVIAYELRKRGLYVKEVTVVKNKHLRIMDAVLKNWDRIIFSNNVSDDYMAQLLNYCEGIETDDVPDSLAGLAHVTIGSRGFKFMKIGSDGKLKENES